MRSEKPTCAPPGHSESFPNVAFETVPKFLWLTIALCRPLTGHRPALQKRSQNWRNTSSDDLQKHTSDCMFHASTRQKLLVHDHSHTRLQLFGIICHWISTSPLFVISPYNTPLWHRLSAVYTCLPVCLSVRLWGKPSVCCRQRIKYSSVSFSFFFLLRSSAVVCMLITCSLHWFLWLFLSRVCIVILHSSVSS